MKKIVVLGSTGSVGRQALEVIRTHPEEFKIVGLACYHQSPLIEKQIKEFKPEVVSVAERDGEEAILQVATWSSADLVFVSVVGMAGLLPTLEAIKAGKDIALATKEVMVAAGELVKKEAKKQGVKIIPVDSEHSAIFQCLNGEKEKEVGRVYLTCSGGPFLGKTKKNLRGVTVKQALNHPRWQMGAKITVDSATLMNKGLEVIEAMKLFNLRLDQTDVVIHPQSIIHSMVEFIDGNVLAQLGPTDMRFAIRYALAYPKRLVNHFPFLNLFQCGDLTFGKPDIKTFRCLELALEAAKIDRTMPLVLNAANEVAVDAFLKDKIEFLKIPTVIEAVMSKHKTEKIKSLEQLLSIDSWARREARRLI